MDTIEDFLQKFGNIIFEEHLELINSFKTKYSNPDVSNVPCTHDNSNDDDVVGMCGCYYFQTRKQKIIKIIEKYKKLLNHFSSISENRKEKL